MQLSPLRRTINLGIASLLLCGGLIGTAALLFAGSGLQGWMVMATGLCAVVGGYWIYEDYTEREGR